MITGVITIATELLLNLLDRGATAWNTWRVENKSAFIDLTYIDLSERDLSGYNFTFADFSGSNLRNTKFINADLSYVLLVGTKLNRACLEGAILEGVNFDSSGH